MLVRRWASTQGTATQASVSGTAWSVEAQLLAEAVDTLRMANWQRGGGKGGKPKRIPRPWEKKTRQIGSKPIPISKFDDWWDSAEAA